MNYWLHRISHVAELSYPLLKKGYLSIGFSDFTGEDFLNKVLAGDEKYFRDQFEDEWGSVPRTRHNLWRFLHFSKGDIVIVPSWQTFYVCEIIDDGPMVPAKAYSENLKAWGGKPVNVSTHGNHLIKEDGEVYDLGFLRKIKVIYEEISRSKFADAKLTSRMKIRSTNADINDLRKSVERSIANYKQNKPIHLHSIVVEKTTPLILETIKGALNPDKFEKLVHTYFRTIGANEVFIPAKNERGKEGDADIVAVFENIKLIIYIQAKFQKGKTSEWGTQQILDYKTNKDSMDDGYNRIAWVITTADSYNDNAEQIAKENEIQLVTGLDFSKMILNAGIDLLNTSL
ncbi:MAG: restriction endonuclease [Salegentibacter mishustinae]|nr:restriction endonuclease [Salegentibacter mishustinae]